MVRPGRYDLSMHFYVNYDMCSTCIESHSLKKLNRWNMNHSKEFPQPVISNERIRVSCASLTESRHGRWGCYFWVV